MCSGFFPRLALAGCLLATLPIANGQSPDGPAWVETDARHLADSSTVADAANVLLESTLAGADATTLIARLERIRIDSALLPVERDAVLYRHIEQLRSLPPGSSPQRVLDWLASVEPLAVTGHEEGPHHAVPVFNVARAARGLANEWSWRRGHDLAAGGDRLPLPALARELGSIPAQDPRHRGMRFAVERLPAAALDQLAVHCAGTLGGCGDARADIELARGNTRWLERWLASTDAARIVPRLQRARRFLSPSNAQSLMQSALEHPDPAVAAWAMSDLTAHLPKDEDGRRDWGTQLLGMLDDRDLGSAAALQLARMDAGTWLEAASKAPLGEHGRRRLELLAEMAAELEAEDINAGTKQ